MRNCSTCTLQSQESCSHRKVTVCYCRTSQYPRTQRVGLVSGLSDFSIPSNTACRTGLGPDGLLNALERSVSDWPRACRTSQCPRTQRVGLVSGLSELSMPSNTACRTGLGPVGLLNALERSMSDWPRDCRTSQCPRTQRVGLVSACRTSQCPRTQRVGLVSGLSELSLPWNAACRTGLGPVGALTAFERSVSDWSRACRTSQCPRTQRVGLVSGLSELSVPSNAACRTGLGPVGALIAIEHSMLDWFQACRSSH